MNLNFSPFPVSSTERLTLRQLVAGDAAQIHELRSNEEVNKMVGRDPSTGIDDALAFIGKIADMTNSGNGIYWVIELKDNEEFAGTVCLYNFDLKENQVEIGYELLPAFHRKGIASEAVLSVIKYAFNTLSAKTITATPAGINIASIKLLEKLNFKFVDSFTVGPDNVVLLNYILANSVLK